MANLHNPNRSSIPNASLPTQAVALGQLDGGRNVLDFSGADNEARLTTALASGTAHLFIPAGTNITITSAKTVPGSTLLRGGGPGAKVTVNGTNINGLVVSGNDTRIEDLEIVACGTANADGASANGCGIFANGRSRLKLRRLKISNHYSYGIGLNSCIDCDVDGNYISASTNVATDLYTQSSDIGLMNGCQYNRVGKNRCYGGATQGISLQIQDSLGAYSAIGNVFEDNFVANCMGYGILLYQRGPSDWTTGTTYTVGTYVQSPTVGYQKYVCAVQGGGTSTNAPTHGAGTQSYGDGYSWTFVAVEIDAITLTKIKGNTVWNILGSQVEASFPSNKIEGAGIYVHDADRTSIIDNHVKSCCLNTDLEQLAPAGIGVNSTGTVSIIGNTVIASAWHGIEVNNDLAAGKISPSVVANNTVKDCTKTGILYKAVENLRSSGNNVEGSGNSGIVVTGVSGKNTRVVSTGDEARGNTSSGFASSGSGITELVVRDFQGDSNTSGLACTTSISRLTVTNCRVENSTQKNYNVTNSATLLDWRGNVSSSGGQSDVFTAILPAGAEYVGAGTPEAVISANKGAKYVRNDGGAGTCAYTFEGTNAANTGWVAK